MKNYQLYRTNPKLGGQVAWNLILEDNGGKLYVKQFDLTPISPYVNFKYGQNEDILNYTHQENLRSLYKEIKGQFYDSCINPQLKTVYPLIDDAIPTRDNSLDLGCSRISFERYGKQLQFLCPVWLEKFGENDVLKFEIVIGKQTDNGYTEISSKFIELSKNDIENHNKFIQYWKNYIHDLSNGENYIGDDVMYINMSDKYATVTGLDIESGDIVTRDISELVDNLCERERPLMETDFMLIDNFHTTQMITKQLFNFNLIFSMSDIVTSVLGNALLDDDFDIKVNVFVNDEILEMKSFNNDYSKQRKFKNVLNYLHDVDYIENIHDNKLNPDICHWVLADNTKYVFNLYSGFSTIYPYFYRYSPNYWETDVKNYPNVLNWCKHSEVGNIDEMMTDAIVNKDFSEFNPSKQFAENTRFDDGKISKELPTEYLKTYTISGIRDLERDINVLDTYHVNYIIITYNENLEFIAYSKEDALNHLSEIGNQYLIFVETTMTEHYILFAGEHNEDMLSYKLSSGVIDVIYNYYIEENFNAIHDIRHAVIEPKVLYLYNTVSIKIADSPWTGTDEIYYVKNNNESTIVIRYDGKIRPMFSNFEDLVWYKKRYMTPEQFNNDPVFSKEQSQGFLPNYPSVGYFDLEFVEDNYDKKNEYKWFDKCRVFSLMDKIHSKLLSKNIQDSYYNNDDLVKIVLKKTYPNLWEKYSDYLFSIYQAYVDYEYDQPMYDPQTYKFNYVYTIKLTLK